jgi:hypothetical protein
MGLITEYSRAPHVTAFKQRRSPAKRKNRTRSTGLKIGSQGLSEPRMANGLLAADLSRIDTMDCRSGPNEVGQRVRAGDG